MWMTYSYSIWILVIEGIIIGKIKSIEKIYLKFISFKILLSKGFNK